jgi:integrase/recombinase XerD
MVNFKTSLLKRSQTSGSFALIEYRDEVVRSGRPTDMSPLGPLVIQTERSQSTSPQAIVNMFQRWYRHLGFVGCSSHSGRRTFITNAARKIIDG